jgi:hypothetical protein
MSQSTPARPKLPLQANPFSNIALQSAWVEAPADVPEVNDAPFKQIVRAIKQLSFSTENDSIVLTGLPGSGKTHLLSRLRGRLQENREGSDETAYIYVRCNASATTLWRHLRQSIASDLIASGTLNHNLSAYASRIDTVENLNLARVLRCILEGRHLLAASAWLRGENLPDSDLAALEVGVERDDEDRSREWEAKGVVQGMLRFLRPTPTVLCFDQVEGLETYLGEQAGFHAFGQLISELHARHEHLLFLSCIVSDYEARFRGSLLQADKDRIFQYEANLRPIEWEPALQIVKARLDSAPALAEARRAHQNDPLWPIDAGALKPLFDQTGLCLPRTLIQACRRQFDACMTEDVFAGAPPPVDQLIQEEYESSLPQARREVERQGADKILAESLPWLLQNSGATILGPAPERTKYANLAYRTNSGETAIALCFQKANSLTNRLKTIDRAWRSPAPALKILLDPANKPKDGAVGAQVLEELKQRGAKIVHPLPEALAALHAIRNLIATAVSGELNLQGNQIAERRATEWLLANLSPQVEQLREELIERKPPPPDDSILIPLLELVARRRVVEADAAGAELSSRPEEVTACARRHPMHFGLLEGPPVVLFKAVEGSPQDAAGA